MARQYFGRSSEYVEEKTLTESSTSGDVVAADSGPGSLPLPGALAGEFFGTFVLVFFGVGAVNAAVVTGAQTGLWQVAVVWAVGVSLGIYTAASLSGAHIQPCHHRRRRGLGRIPLAACGSLLGRPDPGGRRGLHRALQHVLRSDHRVRASARTAERRTRERAQRDGVRRVLPEPRGLRLRRAGVAGRHSRDRVHGGVDWHCDARFPGVRSHQPQEPRTAAARRGRGDHRGRRGGDHLRCRAPDPGGAQSPLAISGRAPCPGSSAGATSPSRAREEDSSPSTSSRPSPARSSAPVCTRPFHRCCRLSRKTATDARNGFPGRVELFGSATTGERWNWRRYPAATACEGTSGGVPKSVGSK